MKIESTIPSSARLERVPHCRAVDARGHETGVTCLECRRCFKMRAGDIRAVYLH